VCEIAHTLLKLQYSQRVLSPFSSSCRITIALAGVVFALPASASAADFSVSLNTKLAPAYEAAITDYTTTCSAGSVSVTTDVPSGLSVKVDGKAAKTGKSTVKLKLKAGQRFQIVVAGQVKSIRCTPKGFPVMTATGTLPAVSPFMAISIPNIGAAKYPYAIITDARGVPVWWKTAPGKTVMDTKVLPGGLVGFWTGDLSGDTGDGPFSIYRLNGTLARDVNVAQGEGDAHEAYFAGSGNVYRISDYVEQHADTTPAGGPADNSVKRSVIQEIDPSGKVVWSWDPKDHIAMSESRNWASLISGMTPGKAIDLMHFNSIEEDGSGGLILSARHLDAVYRINKADGSITWKLGGTQTDKSLTILGDGGKFLVNLSGQHDARVQPDGTVTIYDNGSMWGRAPRATRWQVNVNAQTATLVEEVTDREMTSSAAGGSARRLSDGSWLIAWCNRPNVRAYAPDHGLVFDLRLPTGYGAYRAAPVSASQMTRFALVAGMDAQYRR
jgi:hypothetical protein